MRALGAGRKVSLGLALGLALLCVVAGAGTGCGEEGEEREDGVSAGAADTPANTPAGTERLTLITSGILQGNMAAFERHYSRGRIRRFGDPARVAAAVDRLVLAAGAAGRTPVVLDVGDDLSGSAEALFTKGALMARFLGDLPLAACLLGNLEFAHGQEALAAYARDYEIPFLASNLSREAGGDLPWASRWIVVKAGAVKVLVAGVTPPNLKFLCLPAQTAGLAVQEDVAATLKAASAEKKRIGAQALVVLSQEPLGTKAADVSAALTGTDVDVFVGLDFDREGTVLEFGKTRVLSFPGHNQGQRIQVSELDVHPERGVVGLTTSFEQVDADVQPPKPSVQAYLEQARATYRAELDREVGRADAFLSRSYFTDGDTGNLVCDALRWESKADLALMNSGGVASGLSPGPILVRDLYRVIPFQNLAVTVDVTGAVLHEFVRDLLDRGGAFQVSGLALRLERKPGDRGFKLLSLTADGKDLVPTRTYKVVTSDFMAGRSPTLTATGAPVALGLIRAALQAYLEANRPTPKPSSGRITVAGE